MKYILAIIFVTLISGFISSTSNAEEATPESSTTIQSYEEDITGDGLKEIIELKGILLSKTSKYYRDIWVDIKNTQTNKKWKISYGGGYDPSLQFLDLNQDNITDLFIQISNESKSNYYTYHIHTTKKDEIKRITVPDQAHINGYFRDNFAIDLTISHDEKPISINIEHKKDDYVQLGIYNQNGNLKKPTSIMVDSISHIEPLLISRDKGYGIKTVQHIHGSATHLLGAIETIWYFEVDKWIILRTKWIPI